VLARSYFATYGLPVVIARCGNIYGGGDLNWDRIVPGTIRSLLRNERPIIRSDGRPMRDYVFVQEVVEAYETLAEQAHRPDVKGQAFNFSSERATHGDRRGGGTGHGCPPRARRARQRPRRDRQPATFVGSRPPGAGLEGALDPAGRHAEDGGLVSRFPRNAMIEGVVIHPLRQIPDERGKVMHMLRAQDPHFVGFGEIYFSVVYPGVVKGWHLHKQMVLSYRCPWAA
jgi:NAD dependent epimerase/dehydratase family